MGKRRSVRLHVAEHMYALVVSPEKLDKNSWWPSTTIGGSIQRTDIITGEPDLFDLLKQFAGRRVRVTVTPL